MPIIVAAALAATIAACGSDSRTTPAGQGGPAPGGGAEAEVSRADVEAFAARTPQRAVLEWWRYLQLNDPEKARELYLNPPDLPDLAGQFNFLGSRVGGEVKVISSAAAGEPARVMLRWSAPDGEARRVTLRLQQDGGAWKLLPPRFLDEMVAELKS